MNRTSIFLEEQLQREVQRLAERKGISFAAAVREALAAYVATPNSAAIPALAGSFASEHSDTTVDPVHPDRASVLVTSGPNSISRNPMYVGLGGLLVANAVWRGSWIGLLPVVAFGAFIDRTQIRAEEVALLDKFGAEYDAYRASTPRWIGPSSPASYVS